MQRLFLTGGSGYLGRNLIRHFVAQGLPVHAIARSARARGVVEGLGAVAFEAELSDVEAMARAAQGCDVAVHSAATVDLGADLTVAREVNVEGTRRVIEACRRAGVGRLVHVGTEAVIAEGEPLVQVDETRPIRPERGAGVYSRSKGEAELLALGASDAALAVMCVRPRLIWGRDDTSVLPGFAEAVRAGEFRWLGGGRYPTSTCHVVNVCEGVEAVLRRGRGGEAYFLTDGEPVQFRAFMTRLMASAGVQPPDRELPMGLAWPLAWLLEGLSRLTGKPPLINRQVLALMGHEVTVVDAKARRELGYEGRFSVEAGLAELPDAWRGA